MSPWNSQSCSRFGSCNFCLANSALSDYRSICEGEVVLYLIPSYIGLLLSGKTYENEFLLGQGVLLLVSDIYQR